MNTKYRVGDRVYVDTALYEPYKDRAANQNFKDMGTIVHIDSHEKKLPYAVKMDNWHPACHDCDGYITPYNRGYWCNEDMFIQWMRPKSHTENLPIKKQSIVKTILKRASKIK